MKRILLGPLELLVLSSALMVASFHSAPAQGTLDERQVVTIALAAQAQLDDSVVYLDQIAKLSGGPMALRQRLARLDVAEFKIGLDKTVISSDQVRFRLLLAGIQPTMFRLSGAKNTVVSEGNDPIAARKILGAAAQAIRVKHPNVGQPKDVVPPALDLHPLDKVRLDAKLIDGPRNANLRVDVAILVNGRMREIVPVSFEAAAKTSAPKGNAFDADVRTAAALLPARGRGEILIKARDPVRIVAIVGPAQVVAKGEAQEDGKLGDIIRVRNTESNKTVNGRVESRDVVIVEY